MREAVVVSAARTPIGKAYRGAFNDTQPQALAAHSITAALQRAGASAEEVEDIILAVPCRRVPPDSTLHGKRRSERAYPTLSRA